MFTVHSGQLGVSLVNGQKYCTGIPKIHSMDSILPTGQFLHSPVHSPSAIYFQAVSHRA